MKICERCGVAVASAGTRCPLCGSTLHSDGTGQSLRGISYPQYTLSSTPVSLKTKLGRFIALSMMAILIVVNLATFVALPAFWALVPIESILFVWASSRNWAGLISLRSKAILWQLLLLSVLLVSIDLVGSFAHWSLNYVVPGLLLLTTLLLTMLARRRPQQRATYLGALFVMLGANLLPLLCYPLHWTTVLWPGLVALTFSLVAIIGLLIFAKGTVLSELRKRLHF